jgi:hypothetical protein
MSKPSRPNPIPLMMQISKEIQEGKIREINPVHLILNVMSMCVFPFIARPLFQKVIGIDDQSFMMLMHTRKKEVIDFVKNALKP